MVSSEIIIKRVLSLISRSRFRRKGHALGYEVSVSESSMAEDHRAVSRDPIQTFKEAESSITSLCIPKDLPQLITGSLDGCVRTYDLRMGKMTEDMVGSPVSSVSPSPTSPKDTLLVSSLDGKLRIFDRANGGLLQTFQGHLVGEARSKAAWGYGEGLVLTGDEDGKLWAYSVLDVSALL